MSWLQENYEKAALGGAVVVALGLGALVATSLGAVDEDFEKPRLEAKSADLVPGLPRAKDTSADLVAKHEFRQPMFGDRKVDLLTGIPLFAQKGEQEPVDLLKSPPVHPPIDNTWWLEYRVDPSFKNSPELDPDGDGFSNREEYDAKTNPADETSFPALIDKLRLAGLEEQKFLLKVSQAGETYSIRYQDNFEGKRRRNNSGYQPIGAVFYEKEPAKGRFKLIGAEVREVKNPKTGLVTNRLFAQVEDLSPVKNKKKYDVTSKSPGSLFADYTAVLALNAIGEESNLFKVAEGESFGLPSNSDEKRYKFKEVNDSGAVVIEYQDASGSAKTVNLELVGQ